MTSMIKRLLSVLLTLSMVLGSISIAFAGNETINYLSLGDSNDCPYGLASTLVERDGKKYDAEGYKVDTNNTIASIKAASKLTWMGQFAELLKKETGKTVSWDNLAVAGCRPEELHMFLDYTDNQIASDKKYMGDAYTDWLFNDWLIPEIAGVYGYGTTTSAIKTMSKEYRQKIADADIISMELGDNNFGGSIVYELYLGIREGADSLDLEDLIASFGCNYDVATIRSEFYKLLVLNLDCSIDVIKNETLNKLVDYFLYSYLSYIYHFEYDVNKIYELNPDVELYVTSHYSPLAEITFTVKGVPVPLGKMVNVLFSMLDNYAGAISPNSTKYHFVDFNKEKPEVLWQSVLKDDLNENDKYFMETFVTNRYSFEVNNYNKDRVYAQIKDAVNKYKDGLPVDITKYSIAGNDEKIGKVKTYLAGEKQCISDRTYAQKQVAIDVVMFYNFGAGIHSSLLGHTTKAEAMMYAYTLVQRTGGITAREYQVLDAMGLIDLRDSLQESINGFEQISNVIINQADKAVSFDKDAYNDAVYGRQKEINDYLNLVADSLSKYPALSTAVKLTKNTMNVSVLLAGYIYESGGYTTYNGKTLAVVAGNNVSDVSYRAALGQKLNNSTELIKANGTKPSSQLITNSKASLFVIDTNTGIEKYNALKAKSTLLQSIEKQIQEVQSVISFLSKCGFKIAGVIDDVNNIAKDVDTKMDSIECAADFENAIHKKNSAAIVSYLGMANDERTYDTVINDIVNMSLFTNAMLSANTIYVDLQKYDNNTVINQLAKHIDQGSDKATDRDYSDNIRSVVLDVLEILPVTSEMLEKTPEVVRQETKDKYNNMRFKVDQAVYQILDIFKKN